MGNPPWLRSEAIPQAIQRRLLGRYRWWRSSGAGYGNKPDLAIAFLERSLELAAPGGVLAMLVPAKIATAGYATAARHGLATTTTLNAVVDLTNESARVFEATVYPMAIVASKAVPPPSHRVRNSFSVASTDSVKQSGLTGGAPWILVPDRVREIMVALQAEHPRVDAMFVCQLGLKTGANEIFLDPPNEIEPEVLRWAIRGRDVAPFRCTPRARLLWTHDEAGHVRRDLPPVCAAYLATRESRLRSRRDYNAGPAWILFRVHAATARYRVVWADLARKLVAAALTTGHDRNSIPLNSCYVTALRSASAAERLAASLNSTWLRAAARLVAVPAASGFARFNARTVAQLPLPPSIIADAVLSDVAREGRAGREVQRDLDERMAHHLNLSSNAQYALRAVVDGPARHRR